ncbi:glutathione ABC transporter permease [Petrotoga sp. HKA.pet.4.5]|uniref:ABC transporter permease n=1 Tax=unclassified Petrotoga TaxID=2620614 RepID=UPI000EF14EF1|nr:MULTISPECIES: ABC transporter permease [unclassified Petrotoga]RLL83805.1 glutathione ABC transporter permease [Petrotoga sp. Shatin.DS.tank11.9.2.9.3]RLL90129.1 glutathione ABC transporter permease [Petrotoga sp. HKA.pet.4.5]
MSFSYFIRRILLAIPTVLLVTLIVFVLVRLVPGDVVDLIIGTQNFLSEEQIYQMYEDFGLDKTLISQYFIWLKSLFTGNLGVSLRTGEEVADLLVQRLPVTLELALLSILFSIIIGIPLGMISALKKNTYVDNSIKVVGLVGLSSPAFWIGTIFIVLFSFYFDNFSIFGYVAFIENPLKNLQIFLLPSFTLGLMIAAQILRITRTSMIDVLSMDYVKVAYSKGLSKNKVIYKHAFRNALTPIITITGIQLGYLFGGSIVIENMFALPGLGRLLLQSVNQRDYPVIQAIILFIVIVIVILNLLIDFIYTIIDPRVNLE